MLELNLKEMYLFIYNVFLLSREYLAQKSIARGFW